MCSDSYCDELDDAAVKAKDSNEIIVVSTSRVIVIIIKSAIIILLRQLQIT